MTSSNIELDMEALDQQVKSIADHLVDSLKEPLTYRLRLLLKQAPVKITIVDPSGAANDVTETLNKRELAAVYSLMNYAAHNQNTKPETVQARAEKYFSVPHIAFIPREQFQHAVEYLLDMHTRFLEEI